MSRDRIIDAARRALADNPLMMGEELAHTIGCSLTSLRASVSRADETMHTLRTYALKTHWVRRTGVVDPKQKAGMLPPLERGSGS